MVDPQNLPYDPETTPQWLKEVDSWPWESIGEDKWKKSGSCPRCHHLMDKVVTPVTILAKTLLAEGISVDRPLQLVPDRVEVECNCVSPHKDRPEKESGCGPAGIFDGPIAWMRRDEEDA
jgi:hypothetical protein